jgi:hypothetical protein
MNRVRGSCLSKYDIFLAPTHILKIGQETKGLDDVSFPRSYGGELAQSESPVLRIRPVTQ